MALIATKKIDSDLLGQLIQTLLPVLIQNLPQLIAQLIELFKPKPTAPTRPTPPVVIEEPIIVTPPTPQPAPVFTSSQLNILDITGTEHPPTVEEALAGNACGWGSYIRYDSNPKDQFGNPLPGELLGLKSDGAGGWVEDDLSKSVVASIEWRSTWDGEGGTRPEFTMNVGGNLYNQSLGYACACKVHKEAENKERHTLAVWVRYNLRDGRVVESNEISLYID